MLNSKSLESLFFIYFPSVLIIFLPLFLISGPFLPDLAITLCGVLFIVNSIKGPFIEFRTFYKNKFFILFLLFWFSCILSSFFSEDILYSLQTSVPYIRFGFFVLSTWFLLNKNPKIIFYLYIIFSFSFFILLIDGFFQFFTGENFLGWPIIGNRISSFFKDELILGSYISRLLPLFFATYIYLDINLKKKSKFFFMLIFILSEVLVFLSGERSAFFFINLAALFIIFLSNGYIKMRIIALTLTFITIFFISSYDDTYKKRMVDHTLEQIYVKKNNDTFFYLFSSQHQEHYSSAILMFENNKFIGVGPKMFRKNCHKKEYLISNISCSTHPHNTYIQLLAEVGILGFLQILFLFMTIIYFSFKQFFFKLLKNKILFSDFQIALVSALLISLWPLIPTGNFFNNWINVIYFLPIGFILFSFDEKKNN